ncbi:synaptic vesicle 2-related protein-like [Pieris brassicae]|uniref:Major facilitator superfamily (MFS) profile domain-containing protein n=1 Tax=Pieris brassicae TaxID=7116 RepID=A0A9P0TG81_PIEBR|nr:synaptic vesicle 2-related protein-like [Pieris brassicae]CAH4029369.1 unnamed protein product [Pieris brassicae]
MVNEIKTVSGDVANKEKNAVDIDYALDVAGLGWYNIRYSLCLALFLIAVIIEPLGYAYILPVARCDLQMTETQRGFIGSIPYIGIALTSFPWGYAVDTRGRKAMIVLSSTVAGLLGVLSAFMPDLISFTAIKFLMSLCLACPAAVPYSFIGEILPSKYRDVTLSVTNAMQIFGSVFVPLLGWAILPLTFRVDFGLYEFKPWRLLTVIYALPFLLGALLMYFGPESPKYLMSQGRHDESLEVLKTMYAVNKKKSPDDFPIKYLRMNEDLKKEKPPFFKSLAIQSAPLLKPPYIKWMALIGFLLFGIFANLNGLYVWLPAVLNTVLTGGGEGQTACQVLAQKQNQTDVGVECIETIDSLTFIINALSSLACAVIAVGVSSVVKIIGKKTLLIVFYALIGCVCVGINFATQQILFAILVSSFPILGLCIGPVNAFAVDIFPTKLRGMAVSLSMMVGRFGSVIGMNIAGTLLSAACEITFYGYGGLLFLCALLSFLLPRPTVQPKQDIITISTRL